MENLRGVVRPIVTILFATAVVVGFFLGRLSSEQLMSIALMVIGFWFVDRSAKKSGG